MFFLENAGVGRGAGNSNSSGAGVLTIFPNSLSSWRPSFLRSLALVRSRSFGRSSDGVGEAGARSGGSGGAVLRCVLSLVRVGARGGDSALDGAGGGGPKIMSSVGRCRGRGSDCDMYVWVTTSSAGYITYIPGKTASRRPLAPSEEVYAYRFSSTKYYFRDNLFSNCFTDGTKVKQVFLNTGLECFQNSSCLLGATK